MDDAPELAMALVGDTALLAAALEELGEPGVILCSDITAQLVQGLVHVKTLGSVKVAGQPTEVLVHRVLGRQPRRPPVMPQGERGFSQFVGRTRELTTLRGLLGEVEDGRGQVVGMVGEPGMGKSRLVYEFRCSVHERRLTYLAGRCFSYGSNTPYLPVLDLLRYHCGLTTAIPEEYNYQHPSAPAGSRHGSRRVGATVATTSGRPDGYRPARHTESRGSQGSHLCRSDPDVHQLRPGSNRSSSRLRTSIGSTRPPKSS